MSTASLPSVMTVDEFFDWPTPDGSHRWELVDGIAVAMAPASDRHGSIQAEASRLIGNHLADHRADCRVVIEPGTSPDNHNVRIPDFTVTCGPIDPAARFSAPVLIVEVLSPSNWKKTWDNVVRYTAIESLTEILVLHQSRIMAEVMRRGADDVWDEHLLLTEGDTLTLTGVGFSVPLATLYRTI